MVNLGAPKKVAGGLVTVRAVGIRVVLVMVIVLRGLEDRERGKVRVRVLAGMEMVLVEEEVVRRVRVWGVGEVVVKVRWPVNSVLVVRP